MTPAKEVGGDFFMVDDDRLGLVMADVSGKGVSAALFMAITKTVLQNVVIEYKTTARVLEITNNIMCETNNSGYFVTVWLVILTLSTGKLIYSNAGYESSAVKRAGGGYEFIESEKYPPIATMEDMKYPDETMTLSVGDSIFLYTDAELL